MAISYTKLGRGVFPAAATLDSQTPPLNDTKIPLSDEPPLFLDCSQQPTFVAPQAALCQPANLQVAVQGLLQDGVAHWPRLE